MKIEALAALASDLTAFTLALSLVKGTETITMTMANVLLGEFPDALTGREPYEIEFPFIAAPVSGLDALTVVQNGGTYNTGTIV